MHTRARALQTVSSVFQPPFQISRSTFCTSPGCRERKAGNGAGRLSGEAAPRSPGRLSELTNPRVRNVAIACPVSRHWSLNDTRPIERTSVGSQQHILLAGENER